VSQIGFTKGGIFIMEAVLGRYAKQIYALLRIIAGLLFACHGAQKIFGLFGGAQGSGSGVELLSLFGVAGIIELIGGLMIAFGIYTSYAAFVASGQMAVAFFMVHFPRGFLPIQNGGELAAVYSWLFLYIACRGPVTWSLTKK
jgi:putative oxidoreductase